MAYLVRKIKAILWPDGEKTTFVSSDAIPADTIANEFKTSKNTLSWWKIDNLEEIRDVGASIVSRFDMKQSTVDLLALPYDIIDQSFCLKNTPKNAATAIPDFRKSHYDLCNLTYGALGELCTIIAKYTSSREAQYVYTIDVRDAIQRIDELNRQGKVQAWLLGDYIKEQLNLEDDLDKEIKKQKKILDELKKERNKKKYK